MRLGESKQQKPKGAASRRRGFLRFFLSSWSAALGSLIIMLLVCVAIFAPQLAPSDPYEAESLGDAYSPPGGQFPLGTDVLGRCILSRMIYGSRISLTVGLVVQGISVVVGVVLGVVAGYWEGAVDDIVSNLTNIMFGFPHLLFALAVVTVLGPGLYNTFIALGLAGWPMIARLVRGQALSVKHKQYVEAARAAGCSDFFIITRHILPQCLSPVLVMATMGMAGAILAEAGLSFLGMGAQPPAPSWGSMIARGRDYIWDSPWMTTYPGIAIFLTVLGFNLLGDGLRDFLDPRL